jgi:hypothetical protein
MESRKYLYMSACGKFALVEAIPAPNQNVAQIIAPESIGKGMTPSFACPCDSYMQTHDIGAPRELSLEEFHSLFYDVYGDHYIFFLLERLSLVNAWEVSFFLDTYLSNIFQETATLVVNLRNKNEMTPLMIVVSTPSFRKEEHLRTKIIKSLLKHGARVGEKNTKEQTAIDLIPTDLMPKNPQNEYDPEYYLSDKDWTIRMLWAFYRETTRQA